MSQAVLADPQFSIARILRPYSGFENDYQGLPVTRRIMVTEVLEGSGGEPRDDLAIKGTPGIDPNLVRGLGVPLGSRVLIWFPRILPDNDLHQFTDARYQWSVEWRMRNVFDHRQEQRYNYHYWKQGQGVPDTSGGPPQPRVVIPSAMQTTVYAQPEPSGVADVVAQNARSELYTFGGKYRGTPPINGSPVMPGGATGAIQQGILDPATFPGSFVGATASFYQLIETQAAGDELVIGLTRPDVDETLSTWDFSQNPARIDREVSVFLGIGSTVPSPTGPFPDLGVYVVHGTAP